MPNLEFLSIGILLKSNEPIINPINFSLSITVKMFSDETIILLNKLFPKCQSLTLENLNDSLSSQNISHISKFENLKSLTVNCFNIETVKLLFQLAGILI